MKVWAKYLGFAVAAAAIQALAQQAADGHIDWTAVVSAVLVAAGAYASKPPQK